MARILIVASENKEIKELEQGLSRAGFAFSIAELSAAADLIEKNPPDLILWQSFGKDESESLDILLNDTPSERKPAVIGLVTRDRLSVLSPDMVYDDFIVSPFDMQELSLRIKRLLGVGVDDANNLIKAGDLVIDTAKAEVLVSGQRVELTYREYELLRFLAGAPGRVFSRESLLNKVWGYDYYGGDRTVDVHIRRLRSKIETGNITFIETVRNMGYRFRDDLETKIV